LNPTLLFDTAILKRLLELRNGLSQQNLYIEEVANEGKKFFEKMARRKIFVKEIKQHIISHE
jgi:hypothetical protein